MIQQYGVGLLKYYHICCNGNNAKKKGNIFKYDIIQIIFKYCVSQIYLIVLLPNIKRMYDQINLIEK